MKQILFALLVITLAAGCTTTQAYSSISAASAEQIKPGKTATIEYVDGSSEKVEIRRYGETSVDVVADNGDIRSIDYADIRTIYAKQLHAGKTAGAVLGGVLLLGILEAAGQGAVGFPSGAPAL